MLTALVTVYETSDCTGHNVPTFRFPYKSLSSRTFALIKDMSQAHHHSLRVLQQCLRCSAASEVPALTGCVCVTGSGVTHCLDEESANPSTFTRMLMKEIQLMCRALMSNLALKLFKTGNHWISQQSCSALQKRDSLQSSASHPILLHQAGGSMHH